jgi:hypothetical protein
MHAFFGNPVLNYMDVSVDRGYKSVDCVYHIDLYYDKLTS